MGRHQAVVATRYGVPEVLEVVTVDTAEPGPGEVRLQVLATGVSYADVLVRRGTYVPRQPLPVTPGYDVVGDVVAVGPGVGPELLGRRVAAIITVGGYAEQACAPADRCVPLPPGLDPVLAAAVTLNGVTAHQLVHRVAGVTASQRVLVHGAAGGVGSLLVSLARAEGATVVGTAATERQDLVRQLGAEPVDSRRPLDQQVPDGTIDVAFEGMGIGWRQTRRTLRRGGLLAMYGANAAAASRAAARATLARRMLELGVMAATPRGRRLAFYALPRLAAKDPQQHRADLATVLGLVADGALDPRVSDVVSLDRAADAHRRLESRQVSGKLVLVPS